MIAINDVTTQIPKPVQKTIYPNDYTLLVPGRKLETIQSLAQKALNELQQFSKETGFTFSKTSPNIIFSRSKNRNKYKLKLALYGEELKQGREVRILSLTFDSKFTWTAHIRNLEENCNRSTNSQS